jgi:hypothetical protein
MRIQGTCSECGKKHERLMPEALRSEPGPLYPVASPERRIPDVLPPAPSPVVSPMHPPEVPPCHHQGPRHLS